MSILVDEKTRVVVQGITGREGTFHTEQMLNYGTAVAAGVTPGKGGQTVEGVPVFNTIADAVKEEGVNASCIFVPPAFAADAIMEAASAELDVTCFICGGTGCQASESAQILANFQDLIAGAQLDGAVEASITGCFGFCEKGPIVKIFPDDVFYVQVKPEGASEIFEKHILGNQRVTRLLYEEPVLKQRVETQHEMSFYKPQVRIALRNCGLINPEKIEEYIANGGYQALGKALTEMSPEAVIDVVKRSGLRGTLNKNDKITFYVRHGDYLGRIAVLLTVILLLYSIVFRYIKK